MRTTPTTHRVRRRWAAVVAGAIGLALVASAAPGAAARPAPADRDLTGKLTMTGDVGDFVPGVVDDPVHDPTLFSDGRTHYVFSTGRLDAGDPGGIFARRSTGSLAGPWESLGAIALPEWTREYGVQHLWAPQVVERAGTFHLYYSASSFGTNRSAIGLATTRTPGDLDSWVDQGPILTSGPGVVDPAGLEYNAIDPYVFKARGQWWIAFGSFWSGIKLQRLADDMRTPYGEITSLASNPDNQFNAIENPAVFQRGRYYYLTASWDFCCQGVQSSYKTVVGRSLSPTGPFVGKDGTPMTEGGGELLIDRRGNQIGTGALDVLDAPGRRTYAVHHYYDGDAGGTIRMQVREIEWEDGWPVFSYGPGDGAPTG